MGLVFYYQSESSITEEMVTDAAQGRDVLRHDFGKEKDTPVGQAIAFFDRISRW